MMKQHFVLSSYGGWVVRAVALQSSKTAILPRPRYESHSGLQYWSLKIRKNFTLFKYQGAGWPMAAYNIKPSESYQHTQCVVNDAGT